MQGGQDEMAGFGGLEGSGGGKSVTDLAKEDDIGGLVKSPTKAFRKGGGVGTDFPLGEVG